MFKFSKGDTLAKISEELFGKSITKTTDRKAPVKQNKLQLNFFLETNIFCWLFNEMIIEFSLHSKHSS